MKETWQVAKKASGGRRNPEKAKIMDAKMSFSKTRDSLIPKIRSRGTMCMLRHAGESCTFGPLRRFVKIKTSAIPLLFVFCFALAQANGQEIPLIEKLRPLGRDWSLRQQETKLKGDYEYSWSTFTNSKTGDILSFAADRYTNGVERKVTSSPVRQAATDKFCQGGFPGSMPTQTGDVVGWTLADTLRFNTITLETGVAAGLKSLKAEALEYTYVLENEERKHPNRLAHGYVIAFGDTVVFVQHTSTHVIESSEVNGIALSIIQNHQ